MYKQNMIKNLIRLKSYVSASQIINFWLLDIFCGSFSLLKKKKKKNYQSTDWNIQIFLWKKNHEELVLQFLKLER